MGSLILDVLRQGIWSSFTGGWHFDPNCSPFMNAFHLYLFLFFLIFPLVIHIYFTQNIIIWCIYIASVCVFFLSVKLLIAGLHHIYNTRTCMQEDTSIHDEECNSTRALDGLEGVTRRRIMQRTRVNSEEDEGIEMKVLNLTNAGDRESQNANAIDDALFAGFNYSCPDPCCSTSEMRENGSVAQTIDLKVEFHRKNSSGSSEASIKNKETEPAVSSEELMQKGVVGEGGGGRLSERSRQYSVSVTLGKVEKSCMDPTPARSMQLGQKDEGKDEGEKGLVYWKQKWDEGASDTIVPIKAVDSTRRYTSDDTVDGASTSAITIATRTENINEETEDEEDSKTPLLGKEAEKEGLYRGKFLSRSENSRLGKYWRMGGCNRWKSDKDIPSCDFNPAVLEEKSQKVGISEEKCNGSNSDVSDDQYASIFNWVFTLQNEIHEELPSDQCVNSEIPQKLEKSDEHDAKATEDDAKSVDAVELSNQVTQKSKSSSNECFNLSKRRSRSHPNLRQIPRHCQRRRPKRTTSSVSYLVNPRLPTPRPRVRGASSAAAAISQPSTSRMHVSKSQSDRRREESATYSRAEGGNGASSSSSNNELSCLLPCTMVQPPCLVGTNQIPYFATSRRSAAARFDSRNNRNRHRRSHRRRPSIRNATFTATSPAQLMSLNILPELRQQHLRPQHIRTSSRSTHMAATHNDTSPGAIHMYQNQAGHWLSYTFDDSNPMYRKEYALNCIDEFRPRPSTSAYIDDCSIYQNLSCRQAPELVSPSTSRGNTDTHLYQIRENDNNMYSIERVEPSMGLMFGDRVRIPILARRLRNVEGLGVGIPLGHHPHVAHADLHMDYNVARLYDAIESTHLEKTKRRYIPVNLLGLRRFKIYFNRLSLDALLDHNATFSESVACGCLCVTVSILGAVLLYKNFYRDLSGVAFTFVMATSQYSLLKSVQPDSASPTHGFNKMAAYSRPVYFICCCLGILCLNTAASWEWTPVKAYGLEVDAKEVLNGGEHFLRGLMLFFPLIFTLGIFPQINTCLAYTLEQWEQHIFGGTAVVSLKAAIYAAVRSILVVSLVFGFAYGALNETSGTRHILFSIYAGLLVPAAYHLSRSSSDPVPIWHVFMQQCWPIDDGGSPGRTRRSKMNVEERVRKRRGEQFEASVKFNRDVREFCKPDSGESEGDCEKEGNNVEIRMVEEESESEGEVQIEGESAKYDYRPSISTESIEQDPFAIKMLNTVNSRLQSDLLVSIVSFLVIFAIHRSTIFTILQPEFNTIVWWMAIAVGFVLHYLIPQMRKQLPWLWFSSPLLQMEEHEQFEPKSAAKVTWFEKVYLYVGFVEKNVIWPIMVMGCVTRDGADLSAKYGPLAASIILTVCSLKCLRLSFTHTSSQYAILAFCLGFFQVECSCSETFVVDYFFTSIIYYKTYDLLLKLQFIFTYIAPWQITWGSAFHAFAQPFSLPHSAMMFAQAALSAFLSSPLYPFLGSAIFLTSYPRPVKFWERDYNTRRVDHSNTKMASHLERNVGNDDNNLNSIFYEHLTRSLQTSLCGDICMGRWGEVSAGDCFILASDYLNCLIHVVELGNGFVTFQMRGLEFRGTYCQQREVEAITEGVEENDGCCCCKPGHFPFMLSLNAGFSQRWLAWEVKSGKYIIEGYSISDNPASSMLQVFDFRKMLVSYYVKSIVYYALSSVKLESWLEMPAIREALAPLNNKNFTDLDPIFNMNVDEDYDNRCSGITRNNFYMVYGPWIKYCNSQRFHPIPDASKESFLVTLCFGLSLLGKRTLGNASHNTALSVECFLYGLHSLFKGDFRISSTRDEWIFTDMELLRKVVAPAIRMSLKLHQDHFMAPEEYESPPALFKAIQGHEQNLVISHEGDPQWRRAVLAGKASLLTLRRVMDEGADEYKVIMLFKRYLSFRLIKMNRECVRGLWAGQQQELVFLRNLNPERGSIQNAKQALRNIINSSCDQPIGYPIFVSPLTTSYAETNDQFAAHLGGHISVKSVKNFVVRIWKHIKRKCLEGCSSGSAPTSQDEGIWHEGVYATTNSSAQHSIYGSTVGVVTQAVETALVSGPGSGTVTRLTSSGSLRSSTLPQKPGLVTLAGLLSPQGSCNSSGVDRLGDKRTLDKEEEDKEPILHRVKIIDPNQIHDGINQGRLIDVIWPDEVMRQRGGRNFWKDWVPEVGMEGQVVHRWIPNHPNPNKRSTFDRTILLIKIDDKYIPISESGVQDLGAEV